MPLPLTPPEWDVFALQAPRDVVRFVGAEAANRLLFAPTAANRDLMADAVKAKAGFPLASAVDEYTFNLALEAAEVGVLLGYALARASLLEDWEALVKATITGAGLVGYKPTTRFDPAWEREKP